jgi:hypothetical protein
LTVSDRQKNDRSFAGSSDVRIILGLNKVLLLRFWWDIRAEVERAVLALNVATEVFNRRSYEAITGRMPIGWYLAAVGYATVAILLGWWPWNFLLLLVLFANRNKRGGFYAFPATRPNGPMRPRESYTRGSSL